MFENLKPGDRVIREMAAVRNPSGQEVFPALRQEGRFTEVKNGVARAVIEIQPGRRAGMFFSSETGIHMSGRGYGRLVTPE
jgi:hypothetical protein